MASLESRAILTFPSRTVRVRSYQAQAQMGFSFVVLGVFVFGLLFFGSVAASFHAGHRVIKQRDLEAVVGPLDDPDEQGSAS